jgi:hypothetical protein
MPKSTFMDIAADWADRHDRDVIFVRDYEDGANPEKAKPKWFCIIRMRDARGPYQAEISEKPQNGKKCVDGEKPRKETDAEYRERMIDRLEAAVREAMKKRRFYQPSKALAA